jgi:acyl-Coa thioesterase superfamily protein
MANFAFDEDSRVVADGSEGAFTAGLAGRFVSNGYHEEDFEVWDSAGTLVAQSRQLALILPS